jgi:hypothetical protein
MLGWFLPRCPVTSREKAWIEGKQKVSGPFSRGFPSLLGRAAARPERALQPQTLGHAFRPARLAIGLPPLHAAAYGFQLGFRLRPVH